jgi:hypothetical protein
MLGASKVVRIWEWWWGMHIFVVVVVRDLTIVKGLLFSNNCLKAALEPGELQLARWTSPTWPWIRRKPSLGAEFAEKTEDVAIVRKNDRVGIINEDALCKTPLRKLATRDLVGQHLSQFRRGEKGTFEKSGWDGKWYSIGDTGGVIGGEGTDI